MKFSWFFWQKNAPQGSVFSVIFWTPREAIFWAIFWVIFWVIFWRFFRKFSWNFLVITPRWIWVVLLRGSFLWEKFLSQSKHPPIPPPTRDESMMISSSKTWAHRAHVSEQLHVRERAAETQWSLLGLTRSRVTSLITHRPSKFISTSYRFLYSCLLRQITSRVSPDARGWSLYLTQHGGFFLWKIKRIFFQKSSFFENPFFSKSLFFSKIRPSTLDKNALTIKCVNTGI